MKIMVKMHNCLRCGYGWASRLPLPPRWCAGCASENWQTVKEEKPQAVRTLYRKGPPVKYPVRDLAVGQTVTFPWFMRPDGTRDELKNTNMNLAINGQVKRHGFKIQKFVLPSGLQVTRVA